MIVFCDQEQPKKKLVCIVPTLLSRPTSTLNQDQPLIMKLSKAFSIIMAFGTLDGWCIAKVTSSEYNEDESSSVNVIDKQVVLRSRAATIPLEDLKVKRFLQGKSGKPCNPKHQPFRLYNTYAGDSVSKRFDLCQRGCPDYFLADEFVVEGTDSSKSAKECCNKYPDTSPEGYCFFADQTSVCEKQKWYHYAEYYVDLDGNILENPIPMSLCIRQVNALEGFYYSFAPPLLPTTPKGYKTFDECCEENECEYYFDCAEETATSSANVFNKFQGF
jgi:hypothetical protein